MDHIFRERLRWDGFDADDRAAYLAALCSRLGFKVRFRKTFILDRRGLCVVVEAQECEGVWRRVDLIDGFDMELE